MFYDQNYYYAHPEVPGQFARPMTVNEWAEEKTPRRYTSRKRARTMIRRPLRHTSRREWKFHDVTTTDADIASTGEILEDSLLHIAAGTGESQRVGRKIWVKSLSMHAHLTLDEGTNLAHCVQYIRTIVYVDKQANGAAATVAEILESTAFQSHYNANNVPSRFRILCDKRHKVGSKTAAGDGTTNDFGLEVVAFKFYKRMNLPVEYSSTTGAIGEICCNNIGLMAIALGGNQTCQWKDRKSVV